MSTQFNVQQDQNKGAKPLDEQGTKQEEKVPFPPSPRRPAPQKDRLWILLSIVAVVLILVLTLGTLFIVQQTQRPGNQATPTPVPSPTVATTPTPGDTTPTPTAGVTPGPQPGPTGIQNPAYWDKIIGTQSGVNKVESVSFANIMGTPTQQALVTVRYKGTDAKLDVYVFNNITSKQPARIFKLAGLIKGDAKISGYSTVMTAEVDTNSTLNAGKTTSAMIPDLFREFDWSTEENALVQVAFPGFFPDLTRYQAEDHQALVNQGQDAWRNNASSVAIALSQQFFGWQRTVSSTLLTGGGPHDVSATVRVQESPAQGGQSQGPNILVTLSRLEGNTHNMWVVVGVQDGTTLQLTNIDPRQLITSPVTLQGSGAAFEAVIGHAVIYDHLYTDIGHAQVIGDRGMGQATYSTKVIYTSSYHSGVQEGLVAVYEANGGISNEAFTAIMVKVLLNPEPGVALGPLPCPDPVKDAAHWTPLLPSSTYPLVADQVNCGNLLGKPGLQAVVVAREILGGGPVFRDVFVFDNIMAARPTLLFQTSHLLHGDARISGYSTIMTAEVDVNSSLNKNKRDGDLTQDLFREFQWSVGSHQFVQVAFPGLFPDLTRYQAENDQTLINNGQDTWKNDPTRVSKALVTALLGWKQQLTTRVLSGGGARDVDATVQVQEVLMQGQGPSAIVTLSRLEGNTHNMWVAIGVKDGTALTLTNIQPKALVTSPVKLEGRGNAFENTIGIAYILDHLYNTVGQALVNGTSGTGMGNVPYSVKVSYDTSFERGPQEGVIKIQQTSPMGGDAPAIIMKVLLNP